METMVDRDPITGLYHHHFIELVMKALLTPELPAGVIMFDMDRSNAINDMHGHLVSDRIGRHHADPAG